MPTSTFSSTQDAYISQYFPNQNFGGAPILYVGLFQGLTDRYRSLLSFDISSLPSGIDITSAILRMYISRNDIPIIPKSINVYRLTDSFTEDTVTYSNQLSTGATPDSTATITSEINTFIEWDITDLVREWYTGSVPNNGIMLTGIETARSLVGFWSREYLDSILRPTLIIQYSTLPEEGLIEYPEETVTTTDTWTGSTPIPLGSRNATFGIINIGSANSAQVVVQLSPDGTTWIDNILPFVSISTFAPGNHLIMNTDGHMEYARVAFKSVIAGMPATLAIYAATAP